MWSDNAHDAKYICTENISDLKHVRTGTGRRRETNSLNQMIAEENLPSIIHRIQIIQFN
jgi:hypothetical protein